LKIIFKQIKTLYSRFEVLPEVTTKIDAVCDVTACSQVQIDRLSKKRTVNVFGNKTVSHFRRRKSSKKFFFSSGICTKSEKVHDSSHVCKHAQLCPNKSVFKEYGGCFSTVGNDFLQNVTITGSLLFKQSLCMTSSYCLN
jgi:hypothetical protein